METRVEERELGLYLPGAMESAPREGERYARILGRRIRIFSFYYSWGSPPEEIDLYGLERLLDYGFIPLITWEPWVRAGDLPPGSRPEDQPDFSLRQIIGGRHDDYIARWASALKELQGPIFLRPMHEMNGNWYPWCGKVNGNRPEEYVQAWRRLRAIFAENPRPDLFWVWSPYAKSVPDDQDNQMECYFPGPEEVDWLALDGYNWGNTREWSRWETFAEIFGEGYRRLVELSSGKSLMIAEVGCAESGGDKGRWMEEAFRDLSRIFPRIQSLVWFNMNKECDWRIESSNKSLRCFKSAIEHLNKKLVSASFDVQAGIQSAFGVQG